MQCITVYYNKYNMPIGAVPIPCHICDTQKDNRIKLQIFSMSCYMASLAKEQWSPWTILEH